MFQIPDSKEHRILADDPKHQDVVAEMKRLLGQAGKDGAGK
jgi:hypothetical protein